MFEEILQRCTESLSVLPGMRHVVCLSGGMDSVLLLRVYTQLYKRGNLALEPVVFHLDHRVRPESGEDAEFCAGLAREAGLAFYLETMSAPVFARRTGQSLEEAGRTLRYRAMKRLERSLGEDAVFVTAHHADDYVESVLLHLTRGGGQGALHTMPLLSRVHGVRVFRPLLLTARAQIAQAMENAAYRIDSTNEDEACKRNRIRRTLLPLLKQEGLDPVRMWKNFHEIAPEPSAPEPDFLRLDRRLLSGPSRAAKAALDAACMCLGIAPPGESAVRAVQRSGVIRFAGGGMRLWADERSDVYVFANDSLCLSPVLVRESGHWHLKRGSKSLELTLPHGWTVRPAAAGMRLPVPGGHKKLKKFFQEKSVPSLVRWQIPVALDETGLVRRLFLSFFEGRDYRFEIAGPSKEGLTD